MKRRKEIKGEGRREWEDKKGKEWDERGVERNRR